MKETKSIELLKSKNIKPTLQRIVVLEALLKFKTHPTADEIYKIVSKEYPTISLATIYNTLELFEKNGIIKTMNLNGQSTRFDLIDDKHFHLVHKSTNEIIDYRDPKLLELIQNYFNKNKLNGYKIEDINIEIIIQKEDENEKV